ncbi:MAG: tetratricopeptide repeat protein [Ignavibacteriaceae bacterium]
MTKYFSYIVFVIIISSMSFGQDTTKSLAFKNNRPYRNSPYFYRPDLGYQIWQQFKLIHEANAGDVLAQHELGLRYLMGEGIATDTAYAVYWIKKAADRKLASAEYNYAILLINGWGVEWDPFAAFKYFREAARAGMIQAQYVTGILYTDNLIVSRDLDYAYYWLKKSSSEGYDPAKQIISQIKPKITQSIVDSIKTIEEDTDTKYNDLDTDNDTKLSSPVGLVFIDFDSIGDTVTTLTDSMLIGDLQLTIKDSLARAMKIDSMKHLSELVSPKNVAFLSALAENGSPEAQTIIGQLYERGIYFNKNLITAASYYFRALRIDSPKAPYLLWQLTKKTGFINRVQNEVSNGNVEAKFVWYGLASTTFDNQIAMSDAIDLLQSSADQKYLPAMIELGLNYYTGRYLDRDINMGLRYWREASLLGSTEASIRLITASLYDEEEINHKKAVSDLKKAADEGSVLAQVALAYCYENGIGTIVSKSNSLKNYRMAAQRGSQYAYRELQRLYDEIRPNDPEFTIN